jgi:hypothetical protein
MDVDMALEDIITQKKRNKANNKFLKKKASTKRYKTFNKPQKGEAQAQQAFQKKKFRKVGKKVTAPVQQFRRNPQVGDIMLFEQHYNIMLFF